MRVSVVGGAGAAGARRPGSTHNAGVEQPWGGVEAVTDWYLAHQRDLPWRAPDRTPWGVLVSEVMLQQTPVARVVPAWQEWMARWPDPCALARAEPGEAVRQWDRLGYPRRALRLHAAAVAIVEKHGGAVPDDEAALRALPGVGQYTAAALRAFAFGHRAVVLDTNVRRVLARVLAGGSIRRPTSASPSGHVRTRWCRRPTPRLLSGPWR